MLVKSIKEWLRFGVGIKRWVLFVIVGIALLILGVVEILINRFFSPNYILYFIFLIISGVVLMFIGVNEGVKTFVSLVRDGMLRVDTNSREISSLMVERKLQINGPRVVAIGGGTGLSTMLKGLKYYTSNITAIVTVGDDGGGSGRLRDEMKMLPPGDIRNCLVALANTDSLMEDLMQYRFTDGTLRGQSFGNLFIAAMDGLSDNFEDAVMKMSDVLAVTGKVLPVTLDDLRLKATFQDGSEINGESLIGHSASSKNRIVQMNIIPEDAKAPADVIEAIEGAQAIVMGPGSLFTSIMPNLLIKEVAGKIKESKAVKIYVCNIMSQPGETDDFNVSDHIEAIKKHADLRMMDYVVVNNGAINDEIIIKSYKEQGSKPVETDHEVLDKMGVKIIEADVVNFSRSNVRHDPEKLANTLINLIMNDKKLKAGTNILEYMLTRDKKNIREDLVKMKKKSKLN